MSEQFWLGYAAALGRLRREADAHERDYLAAVSETLAAHGALIASETPRARDRLLRVAERQRRALEATRVLRDAADVVETEESLSLDRSFCHSLSFQAAGSGDAK